MKVAITGKAEWARAAWRPWRPGHPEAGDPVVVIDADPDMNMATLLGVPPIRPSPRSSPSRS